MSCGLCREAKLLEHAMKIVERMLERQVRTLINLNTMHFRFMPGKETVNTVFVERRIQKEYQIKKQVLYVCLVDMERVFNRVTRKLMEGP